MSQRKAGFTLIEILIVLFIVSIVASTVLLTMRHNERRQIEAFAHELYQQISLAQEEAILLPSVIGIRKDEDALQFLVLSEMNKKGRPVWVPLESSQLGKTKIRPGIELHLQTSAEIKAVDEEDDENRERLPEIIISTNGDISPFTMTLGKEGDKPLYLITALVGGQLSSKALY